MKYGSPAMPSMVGASVVGSRAAPYIRIWRAVERPSLSTTGNMRMPALA